MAAAPLQRRSLISVARVALSRYSQIYRTRSLPSDALVEIQPGEIGIVSGIPKNTCTGRTLFYLGLGPAVKENGIQYSRGGAHMHILKDGVLIYSPARTATQQGSGKVGRWKIDFLSTQKWENPLMGWTSTSDSYANVGDAALSFDSEEAAKAFAEKHGWDYVVKKWHTPILRPKSYADNFNWKGLPKPEED